MRVKLMNILKMQVIIVTKLIEHDVVFSGMVIVNSTEEIGKRNYSIEKNKSSYKNERLNKSELQHYESTKQSNRKLFDDKK